MFLFSLVKMASWKWLVVYHHSNLHSMANLLLGRLWPG